MSELSNVLKKVLANVNALSDEALQAEFDACRNGPVGRAILEGQRFVYCQTLEKTNLKPSCCNRYPKVMC